jgi:hypothetical protein
MKKVQYILYDTKFNEDFHGGDAVYEKLRDAIAAFNYWENSNLVVLKRTLIEEVVHPRKGKR